MLEINKDVFLDDRGALTKVYCQKEFGDFGINTDFFEAYYSISKKNVLRGMHFQIPPGEHSKLINVIEGEILDVVVAISGPLKGEYFSLTLSKENSKSLYIPPGYAHGFLVKSPTAVVLMHLTGGYCPEFERGIKYDSFGFEWGCESPVISAKDCAQLGLDEV